MQNKIPQLFLLIALIAFVLTAGHWLWREGERSILALQSERALLLVNALQEPEQIKADDIRDRIEQAFQENPDFALVLLNNQKQEPLFFKTRLEEETVNWVRGNLTAENAPALLSARQFNLYTHELVLGKKTRAFLHIVYSGDLLCEHRTRILIICLLAAGIIVLIWTVTVLLSRSAVTAEDDTPVDTRDADVPAHTEIKKQKPQQPAGADVDALTSLLSRGAFNDLLETKSQDPQNHPLALIIADFDHFRDFNESFGHSAGNTILKKTAALFLSTIPAHAFCCRFSGEEFAVLIPGCSLAKAMALADGLRLRFAKAGFFSQKNLTMSFGVSAISENQTARPQNLIQRAEGALIFSKTHGRNMVSSSPDIAG